MAFDAFLKIDGIDGEATEEHHKKWIMIDSFSWGVTNNVDVLGAGLTSGKAMVSGFSFSKLTDESSPKLALYCCTGKHIKSADLHLCQSSGDRVIWLTYNFTECIVSSFAVGGAPGGSDRPAESLSIHFAKWNFIYKPTDEKGLLPGQKVSSFDLKLNKGSEA